MSENVNWKKISDHHTIALGVLLVSNFIIGYTKINSFLKLTWCFLVFYTIVITVYGAIKAEKNK
jgi:hypothetical protein